MCGDLHLHHSKGGKAGRAGADAAGCTVPEFQGGCKHRDDPGTVCVGIIGPWPISWIRSWYPGLNETGPKPGDPGDLFGYRDDSGSGKGQERPAGRVQNTKGTEERKARTMLMEFLEKHPMRELLEEKPLRLFPDMDHRDAWEDLAEAYKREIRKQSCRHNRRHGESMLSRQARDALRLRRGTYSYMILRPWKSAVRIPLAGIMTETQANLKGSKQRS